MVQRYLFLDTERRMTLKEASGSALVYLHYKPHRDRITNLNSVFGSMRARRIHLFVTTGRMILGGRPEPGHGP